MRLKQRFANAVYVGWQRNLSYRGMLAATVCSSVQRSVAAAVEP